MKIDNEKLFKIIEKISPGVIEIHKAPLGGFGLWDKEKCYLRSVLWNEKKHYALLDAFWLADITHLFDTNILYKRKDGWRAYTCDCCPDDVAAETSPEEAIIKAILRSNLEEV